MRSRTFVLAIVAALLGRCCIVQAVTVDGVVSPGEWTIAEVIITDPDEPAITDDNYDLCRIMLCGGPQLNLAVTVYGDHPALAAPGSINPYLNFYFNLYSGGSNPQRFGISYNDGYGFAPGQMHLVRYDQGRWQDMGAVAYAIDTAVEVVIPWGMFPTELTQTRQVAYQSFMFLYNVAPGDANSDGKVNVGDLAILASSWQTSSGANWPMADFNNDGQVNVGDLAILASHWGYAAPGGAQYDIYDSFTMVDRNMASLVHTPEPVTALTAVLGIGALATYVRRRRRAPRGAGRL